MGDKLDVIEALARSLSVLENGTPTAAKAPGAEACRIIGDLQPPMQNGRGYTEVVRDMNNAGFAPAGYLDHVTAKLFRNSFRHAQQTFACERKTHKADVN